MVRTKILIQSILILLVAFSSVSIAMSNDKPRLLVLTDIGGDPDDIQSLRRLLVYSNEFRIEGIVATATSGPREIREPGVMHVFTNLIHDAINDYERVRDNLLLHLPGYPTADELRAVVREGKAYRGVLVFTSEFNSPGADHIIKVVDASNEVLNITIWGGAHDLAQALNTVKSSRDAKETDLFVSKLRVYAIADQDKREVEILGTGEWIKINFPKLRYVESGPPFDAMMTASFRGMYQNDSHGGRHPMLRLVRPGKELNDEKWVIENVNEWGPLGAGYPAQVNQNPNTKRNTMGVKEGDTPSMFYFLPHGLNDPEKPEWGGWGGRFYHQSGGHYIDAQDNHWSGEMDGGLRRKWAVARWRESYQNDFAARMRWCLLPFEEANHNPVAVIDKDDSKNIIIREVRPGQTVKLDARGSFDPDGDKLDFNWWIYQEPSSSLGMLKGHKKPVASITVPASAPEGDVHIILEVKDGGSPALFSFRRVVLRVKA